MPGDDTWESATPHRQLTWWLCDGCDGELTEHRVIVDRHTQTPKQWCCTRCHTYTQLELPFSAIEPPTGKEQIESALKTLAIFSPIFMDMDQKRLYTVTGRYFAAGWSVKDILRAIDYRPDESPHETAALNPRHSASINLARVATRLREWVWRNKFEDDEGGDIMPGPYTEMRTMMRVRHQEQQVRSFSRSIEWSEQERLAREARANGTPELARRQVAIARELAKHFKQEGNAREAAALAEQLDRVRTRPPSLFPSVSELTETHWADGESLDVDSERNPG